MCSFDKWILSRKEPDVCSIQGGGGGRGILKRKFYHHLILKLGFCVMSTDILQKIQIFASSIVAINFMFCFFFLRSFNQTCNHLHVDSSNSVHLAIQVIRMEISVNSLLHCIILKYEYRKSFKIHLFKFFQVLI